MLPVLSRIGVHCATIGNHDLDFGTQRLRTLIEQSGFPWVQSNLKEAKDSLPLAGAYETLILPWKGWRVGLIGLAEREWLDIIGPCSAELLYEDFCLSAQRHALQLRQAGCDVVIALTHMRNNNEVVLAEQCKEIDLILGGHDHLSKAEMLGDCPIVKSGSDFEELTIVEVSKNESQYAGRRGLFFSWWKVPVTAEVPQDPAMESIVQQFVGCLVKRTQVLAYFKEAVDCRFSYIRSEESEIGNLLSDIVRDKFQTDFVLINSGHVRLNGFIPAGQFTERDLHALLPVKDNLCRVEVTGEVFLEALNSAFSKLPALEGRFPMLSGISVTVDTSRNPRVYIPHRVSATVQGQPLDPQRFYSVIVKHYVATGSDGYSAFLRCRAFEEMKEVMLLTCLQEFLQQGKARLWAEVSERGLVLNPKKDGRLQIARSD